MIADPIYAAWQVTLLESLQKRCDFLEHVAQSAGLTNIQVVRNRAEVSLYSSRDSYAKFYGVKFKACRHFKSNGCI